MTYGCLLIFSVFIGHTQPQYFTFSKYFVIADILTLRRYNNNLSTKFYLCK